MHLDVECGQLVSSYSENVILSLWSVCIHLVHRGWLCGGVIKEFDHLLNMDFPICSTPEPI